MSASFEWSSTSGDAWAERWQQIDRALADVGETLVSAALEAAPPGSFRAFDIGCGAGASSIALASARPDATILGCDLSPALVQVARERAAAVPGLQFTVGDAAQAAPEHGPIDLFLSRHGVMFFSDPPGGFRAFRAAAGEGAEILFSCFKAWDENAWASELASAAAGRQLPPPGREPSGFAFADPDYVAALLQSGGWVPAEPRLLSFDYVAAEGEDALEQAMAFLVDIGPASSVVRSLGAEDRSAAVGRMRRVIERYRDADAVRFPAAAWIWRASR